MLLGRTGAVPAFLAVAKTAGARGSPAPGYSQHIPEPFFTKAKSLLAQGLSHKRVQNSCIKRGCWQQQSQTIVPVLLMAREKDGALPTARTDPHFTERKLFSRTANAQLY